MTVNTEIIDVVGNGIGIEFDPGPEQWTINPGILWAGQSIQLGIEAVIPANSRTGRKTGVLAQLHFYLDDIFPTTIGKPLFGN